MVIKEPEHREMVARQELTETGHQTVIVDQFTNGILDPNKPMLGPVRDGGHIIGNTAPGCWGPGLSNCSSAPRTRFRNCGGFVRGLRG